MKAIIFGANSQDGFYLNKLLQKRQIDVINVSRSKGDWFNGDVSNSEFVASTIKNHKPEFIYHFAAVSSTRHRYIYENYRAIVLGTLNILESAKKYVPESKIFITGSGLQFINNGMPISEKNDFNPSNQYSLSRINSVYIARYYRSIGLKVYVGYLFHHESPYRKENHISKIIAEKVKEISRGIDTQIDIGDLYVEKEWTFAGDVVEAIMIFMNQDNIYEATIGSGVTYTIRDWIESCFRVINKDWSKYVSIKDNYKADYKKLICDCSTMNNLGWKPTVSLYELAKMMVTE